MKTDMIPSFIREIAVAFSLLTRLPLPSLPAAVFERSAASTWAYPLVGATLGLIAGATGTAALWVGLPAEVAAGLTLVLLMLTTGGMHEDGLADTADGFWGGFDRDRRLEIMKDSQIGTYGTLSLIVTTGLRWAALTVLLPAGVAPVVAAACVSRAGMPVLMYFVAHARGNGLSHSVGRASMHHMLAALCLAGAVGAVSVGFAILAVLAICAGVVCAAIALTKHKIGGQTGDVLGATQVIAEVMIMLTLIIVMA